MFRNILVPTDLTEKSLKALEIALKVCSDGEFGMITLLHVIETIDDADEEEFEPFYEKLRDRAWKKMDEIVARTGSERVNTQTRILYGKRVREIVRFAGENAVDLIVLSSHRIEKIDPSEGWATISYRVAILAPCTVLVVK